MVQPASALSQALKRRRNPWNWSLQAFALFLLCMALWFSGPLLYACGIILFGASLFELHLPEMKLRLVWRLMRAEREWFEAPWSARKRTQALGAALLAALLFWSLAVGDVALLLLAVGGAVMLATEAAQATMDVESDEDTDSENEENGPAE